MHASSPDRQFPGAEPGARRPDHPALGPWTGERGALCPPNAVFYCDGSDAGNDFLLVEASRLGAIAELDLTAAQEEIFAKSGDRVSVALTSERLERLERRADIKSDFGTTFLPDSAPAAP